MKKTYKVVSIQLDYGDWINFRRAVILKMGYDPLSPIPVDVLKTLDSIEFELFEIFKNTGGVSTFGESEENTTQQSNSED